MSQRRPSQSPAGPSRLPVYLTGAPRLSSSSSTSTRLPKASTSASNQNAFKRSSAFQSFDAPAYCNDMAGYIAEQLAIKPKRVSRRDQEIEAGLVKDKWRGSSFNDSRADLADVSVQTTVDDEESSIFGADKEAYELNDEIDISRTEMKKAEADAFLRQLRAQPDELTETERGLEEQVLSFFGAEVMDQSSEIDNLEKSSEVQPEVATQIANMLAEKEKGKASGPLIEEVVQTDVEHQTSSSADSSDVEEAVENGSEESGSTSEDEESDSEDDERRVLSYDERRDALMRANAVDEDDNDDEGQEQLEAGEENDDTAGYSDDEADVGLPNGIDLYHDSPSAQPPVPFSETIELLDSDEEEEEEVDQIDGIEDGIRREGRSPENEMVSIDAVNFADAGSATDGVPGMDLYNPAAVLDIGEEWTNEPGQEASVDDNDVLEEDARLRLTQEIEAAASANLFEQPESAFFSGRSSSFAPLEIEQVSADYREDVASLHSSSAQGAREEPAPNVLPHLRQAETGDELASMKEELASSVYNISQAPSLSVQVGTPQRAESIDQPRDSGDGHARHARDLFHIKSVAQRTLEGQASLATSLASDIDSAPHHSDVDIGTREQSVPEAITTGQDESTEANEQAESEVHNSPGAGDSVLPVQYDDGRGQESIQDELVEYIELAGSAMGTSEEGHDIDIQSFNGSHSSEHIYGYEEEEVHEDPTGVLVTILEEHEMEVPSPVSREGESKEQEKEEELRDSVEVEPVTNMQVLDEDAMEKAEGEAVTEKTEAPEGEAGNESEKASREESLDVLNSYTAQDLQGIAEQLAEKTEQQEEIFKEMTRPEGVDFVAVKDNEEEELPEAVNQEEEALTEKPDADGVLDAMTEDQDAEEEASTTVSKPRRSTRSRTQTAESVSPTITKRSLRKSQSRAPSEVAEVEEKVETMPVVQEESPVKTAATPKRSRRSRTATVESPLKTPKRSLRSASRAVSEAASEGSPRKHRHHHRRSDASGDLADFVPEEAEVAEEEEEEKRPTKRAKVNKNKTTEEEMEAEVEDADEDMLDTSILEEDESQMQIDEQEKAPMEKKAASAKEEEEEVPVKESRPPRRRKSAPRKSADAAFRVQKVEESDSDEDKEAKAKKDELIKQRREAEREKRQKQREAKKRKKELQQKEEKEAERAAAGIVRKARISEDVKTFKPPVADEEEQEEEAPTLQPEETIAKRRSKRKAA